MLAVHDLLKIASISKIESDEILGLPECDCLIRQFAGKLNAETRVLVFSVFESGVNLLVKVLAFRCDLAVKLDSLASSKLKAQFG